jgi:hypothetical protein
MAHNPDRFVVIDGVQVEKSRAIAQGLIKDSGKSASAPVKDGKPTNTRARTSGSAGKKATTPGPVTSTGVDPAAAK